MSTGTHPVLDFLSQEMEDGAAFLRKSTVTVPVPAARQLFLENGIPNGYILMKIHSLIEEKNAPSEMRNTPPSWLQFWLFPHFSFVGIALDLNISLFFCVNESNSNYLSLILLSLICLILICNDWKFSTVMSCTRTLLFERGSGNVRHCSNHRLSAIEENFFFTQVKLRSFTGCKQEIEALTSHVVTLSGNLETNFSDW